MGKVKDVVFDHQNGDIRYLIVDAGKRLLAVPADHVFRTVQDEDSFSVDMARSQFEALPDFSPEYLENERRWNEFHAREEESLADWRKEMERKYKQSGWHEAPVQHRQGSSRNITPEPEEIVVGRGSLGEDVVEPLSPEITEDLTPHRIAGKFPDPRPGRVNLRPDSAVDEERVVSTGPELRPFDPATHPEALDTGAEERRYSPSARWRGFEELLRKNRVDITAKCPACAPARDKAA
jgi:hypothetical protein